MSEEKSTKHSATPWRFEPESRDELAAIVDGDELSVMILDGAELEDDDLDFILLAVNSHTELVDALKAMLKVNGNCGSPVQQETADQAQRVIEHAEAEI